MVVYSLVQTISAISPCFTWVRQTTADIDTTQEYRDESGRVREVCVLSVKLTQFPPLKMLMRPHCP